MAGTARRRRLSVGQSAVTLDEPINALISYHYFARSDLNKLTDLGLRVIGDSGAFSAANKGAHIDLGAFADWITQWRHVLYWVASLDVIGDREASWANWQRLRDLGHDTVPTLHYGTDPTALDRYGEAGVSLVGLGGMVAYKTEQGRLLRWCAVVMRYARDHWPTMRFHGWGVTQPQLLVNLPWWSVDSTTFTRPARYGQLPLFDPDRGRMVHLLMNGRQVAGQRRLLERHYGLTDWRAVSQSRGSEAGRATTLLAMRSMQLWERYLIARHAVTPPPGFTEPGTRIHLACVPGNVKALEEE